MTSKINKTLQSGRDVEIAFIYRDKAESFENGVLGRMKETGRPLPIDYHLDKHDNALRTINKLKEKYKDNPNVKFNIIDNSLGKGKQEITNLDSINKKHNFDNNATREQLYNRVQQEHQSGQITTSQFNALTKEIKGNESGRKKPEDSGRTGEESPQSSQSRQDNLEDPFPDTNLQTPEFISKKLTENGNKILYDAGFRKGLKELPEGLDLLLEDNPAEAIAKAVAEGQNPEITNYIKEAITPKTEADKTVGKQTLKTQVDAIDEPANANDIALSYFAREGKINTSEIETFFGGKGANVEGERNTGRNSRSGKPENATVQNSPEKNGGQREVPPGQEAGRNLSAREKREQLLENDNEQGQPAFMAEPTPGNPKPITRKAYGKLVKLLKKSGLAKSVHDAIEMAAYLGKEGTAAFRKMADLSRVNARFNEELQQLIKGKLPNGHIFKLGNANKILQAAGIGNKPIELAASLLKAKSIQAEHPFDLSEVKDLAQAIQNPIAVFNSKTVEGRKVIFTELSHFDP